MPMIMSLEGPKPDRLAALRGQLYASVPRKWWRFATQLEGFAAPWSPGIGFLIGSFALGAWLGGSQRGRRVVSTIRGR